MEKLEYGTVSAAILKSENLSINDKAVYIILSCFKNDEEKAFPSLDTISEILKLSVSTISTCVHKLEELNILKIMRRFNNSNMYLFKCRGRVRIERKFIKHQGISKNSKVILAAMMHLKRATVNQIVDFLHISRPTATKCLKELVKLDILHTSNEKYDTHYLIKEEQPISDIPQYQGTVKVPVILLNDPRLSSFSKGLYIALLSKLRSNCDNLAVISHSDLMKILKCGFTKLTEGAKQLIRCGYISRKPCYKGYVYTLLKRDEENVKLYKEIILNPKTNYRDIIFYALNKDNCKLQESYRYRKLRRLKYISKGNFVNLKTRYTHLKGHRLNVEKYLNFYKIMYINSTHFDMVKKICSAIVFDYRQGGVLYDHYCDKHLDVQKLCIMCKTHMILHNNENSITQILYEIIYDNLVPINTDNKKYRLNVKRKDLFCRKISNALIERQYGAVVKVLGKIGEKSYSCLNTYTMEREVIFSVSYVLKTGRSYCVQKATYYEPKLKTGRTILIYAEKYNISRTLHRKE